MCIYTYVFVYVCFHFFVHMHPNRIMVVADQESAASYMQNGFWCDHWTYTLDMIGTCTDIYVFCYTYSNIHTNMQNRP